MRMPVIPLDIAILGPLDHLPLIRLVRPIDLRPRRHIHRRRRTGNLVPLVVNNRLVRVADLVVVVPRQDLNVGLVLPVLVDEEARYGARCAGDSGADPDGGVEKVPVTVTRKKTY